MFFDIGSLEFIVLIVLAILVFGPEKLPKMIQDATRFLRKIREFSDSAKQDIRSELGPEFKDFEFQDLNPRTFAKKHLLDGEDLGLKELGTDLGMEDMRKELTEVTDTVNGRNPRRAAANRARGDRLRKTGGAEAGGGQVSLAKQDDPASPTIGAQRDQREEPPPFDADAT